jgi:hypothetical protein
MGDIVMYTDISTKTGCREYILGTVLQIYPNQLFAHKYINDNELATTATNTMSKQNTNKFQKEDNMTMSYGTVLRILILTYDAIGYANKTTTTISTITSSIVSSSNSNERQSSNSEMVQDVPLFNILSNDIVLSPSGESNR